MRARHDFMSFFFFSNQTKTKIHENTKKVIYACNVADTDLADGNAMVDGVRKFAEGEGSGVVVVSAQVESELVDLDGDDKREFLESLGGKSALCVCECVCRCVCVRARV